MYLYVCVCICVHVLLVLFLWRTPTKYTCWLSVVSTVGWFIYIDIYNFINIHYLYIEIRVEHKIVYTWYLYFLIFTLLNSLQTGFQLSLKLLLSFPKTSWQIQWMFSISKSCYWTTLLCLTMESSIPKFIDMSFFWYLIALAWPVFLSFLWQPS